MQPLKEHQKGRRHLRTLAESTKVHYVQGAKTVYEVSNN